MNDASRVRASVGGVRLRRIRRLAVPAAGGAALLALLLFLQQSGQVRELQDKAYDFHQRTRPARAHSEVAIVRITDDDFRDLFGRRSPPDPGVLGRVLEAAAAGGPAVIGVDIDTHDPAFADLVAPDGAPVVWGRGLCPAPGSDGVTTADLCAVLGGRLEPALAALTALRPSADWSYRRYSRCALIGDSAIANFSTAVLAAAGLPGGACERGAAGRRRMIDYRGHVPRVDLSAGDVLRLADSPAFRADGPLRGKLVLIGADYREAHDRHVTPLGPMAGVDIWAHILDTERDGGGAAPPATHRLVAIQLVAAAIVALIVYGGPLPRALLVALLATPVLALAAARLGFGTWWHAPFFLPATGLVLLWAMIERAHRYNDAFARDVVRFARDAVARVARDPLDGPPDRHADPAALDGRGDADAPRAADPAAHDPAQLRLPFGDR